MPPGHTTQLHAFSDRLARSLRPHGGAARWCLPLMLCAAPLPAFAQDTAAPPAASPAPAGQSAPREIAFEANDASYDQNTETVTASGDVILKSGDQSVRADTITWNRSSGQIVATGNIRLVDENGNQLFTDRVELTDELKAGAMSNLLLVFRQGARMAAAQGRRDDSGVVVLDRAAYSACAVENRDGCETSPSWRVTARRVTYDQESQQVRFDGAYLELFGRRVLPLPGLMVRADGGPISGFLVPNVGLTASNGLEVISGYYWRLAPNRDLTATAFMHSGAPPMLSAQYRELTAGGAYQVTAYGTYGSRIPLSGQTSQNDLRGYVAANGKFQLDQNWSLTASARFASDRTFLRRYDISRDDRLRSTINVERITGSSYLSIAGWVTQALLVQQGQGEVPVALPVIDYRHRFDSTPLGGRLDLQLNTLAITRTTGQDTQRAFAKGEWQLRRVTPLGQEVTLTGLLRGDVYHSSDNLQTQTVSYRGESGWQGRAIAVGAVDVKWPFVGELMGGTQVLTPRVQLVASPDIRNLAIPNEDARAIDLEDSNLFALNRFPGYDRIEDGVRFTYGADWQLSVPGWQIKATVGQSYRMTDQPSLFPTGTGLDEQFSDFVGRTEVRYRDFLKFTHRYRLDKHGFAVRRNELDATIGSSATYLELGYLRLNSNVDLTFEDLQDREEARVAGRVAFARYWSVFGSAVVNLTDREEDPTLTSDGFEPLRTRLGVAYTDDCLEFGFTWRRDYASVADAKRGDSFRVYFSLRNLGFR
ncbi:MAG: LPS-assembly protein LptD precursor [Pseudomonadota bacterium]|jgi:LPS-assembly protein